MSEWIDVYGFKVVKELYDFVNDKVLLDIGVDQDYFWKSFLVLVYDLLLKNKVFFEKCDVFQEKLDVWYWVNFGMLLMEIYKDYLFEIGYLVFQGDDFEVGMQNIDFEIGFVVGLQFVVLVMNVCYVFNVVNVCWGLFYDVFYGIDVMGFKL